MPKAFMPCYLFPDEHTINTGVDLASPLHKLVSLMQGSRLSGSLSSHISFLISRSFANRTASCFCFFTFLLNKSVYCYIFCLKSFCDWFAC
jgi:hypothetical protein